MEIPLVEATWQLEWHNLANSLCVAISSAGAIASHVVDINAKYYLALLVYKVWSIPGC